MNFDGIICRVELAGGFGYVRAAEGCQQWVFRLDQVAGNAAANVGQAVKVTLDNTGCVTQLQP